MAFKLENVVPWGRNLKEYTEMFNLTQVDLNSKIISFGDGPASFNVEMTKNSKSVLSLDPIYQFRAEDLQNRIEVTKDTIFEQTKHNQEKFVWEKIKNVDELLNIRMKAMDEFLLDFEKGKKEKRYLHHELPNATNFEDKTFDLGLSSHFLLLYSQLGLEFHINSFNEILRICKEVRVFPILNLNAEQSEVLNEIMTYFSSNYIISIETVDYEFQKGGNKMLKIKSIN